MKRKLDSNHKKKCKLLILVSQGRISVETALKKMAKLDGESLLPPVVEEEPMQIDESAIPF